MPEDTGESLYDLGHLIIDAAQATDIIVSLDVAGVEFAGRTHRERERCARTHTRTHAHTHTHTHTYSHTHIERTGTR